MFLLFIELEFTILHSNQDSHYNHYSVYWMMLFIVFSSFDWFLLHLLLIYTGWREKEGPLVILKYTRGSNFFAPPCIVLVVLYVSLMHQCVSNSYKFLLLVWMSEKLNYSIVCKKELDCCNLWNSFLNLSGILCVAVHVISPRFSQFIYGA